VPIASPSLPAETAVATTRATSSPAATSRATSTPVASASSVPQTTKEPIPAVTTQPLGGVITSSSPTDTPAPTATPHAKSVLKPVLKDISENAVNTLLETPLSVFIPQNPKNVYRSHGLSPSSTTLLLSSSGILGLCGFVLLYWSAISSRFIYLVRKFKRNHVVETGGMAATSTAAKGA